MGRMRSLASAVKGALCGRVWLAWTLRGTRPSGCRGQRIKQARSEFGRVNAGLQTRAFLAGCVMSTPQGVAPEKRLRAITISGWRQFQNVRIDLHDRLTILTGANGAGKTTILNLIAPHFGWTVPLATTPSSNPLTRALEFVTNAWPWRSKDAPTSPRPDSVVGRIEYDQGETEILIPQTTSEHTYIIRYANPQRVRGLYIPSHRPVFVPTPVKPKLDVSPIDAFARYSTAVRTAWMPGLRSPETPLESMKSTLLGWLSRADSTLGAGFIEALRTVLPTSLGFQGLTESSNEILVRTETGDFTIDAVSGGIAALIDLTWQIYTYAAADSGHFVVLIDEPENHLHPELQRSVLHKLTRAFPVAQFIVASHAPLVVTSVRKANVYALIYRDTSNLISEDAGEFGDQRWIVEAEELSAIDRAGTANEVLRDVLGLDYTMPVWAATIFDEAVNEVANSGYTPESLAGFESRLIDNGLASYVPKGIAEIAERGNRSAGAGA